MSWQERLAAEPWLFSFLNAVAKHEAVNPDKPRIGDTDARRQEYLDLGQVPHLDFGPSNVATYQRGGDGAKARMRVKFMGMLGPMGPLPTHMTEEALEWYSRRDDAFVRFLDIFNNRFLQLFYRAHADCRPALHAARPRDDRFRHYVGSAVGIGSDAWASLDALPDFTKLEYAGLLGPRTRSASRIAHLVMGVLDVSAEVESFIGSVLTLSKEEQSRLGLANAVLGQGAMAGARVTTVDTKFRLRLFVDTLSDYEKFLPGRAECRKLIDTVTHAVGFEYDWDVELVLREQEVRSAQLGAYGRLGWTTWMRDSSQPAPRTEVRTRFSPLMEDAPPAGW